jgi:uncharacterized OB-fold protein
MSQEAGRPLPVFPDADTEPFWAATRRHELTYQRCDRCGRVVFYPRAHCPHCGSLALTVHISAGRGSVYTYTVIRRQTHPFFRARAPYVLAYIDLAEGFRMLAEVAASPAEMAIGQPVSVGWEDHELLSVPVFRLG